MTHAALAKNAAEEYMAPAPKVGGVEESPHQKTWMLASQASMSALWLRQTLA
jgi:hypothetical protein